MYRFLLRPLWILSHLFVIACVVAFVNLGFWQLRRLDERRAHNAEVEAAVAEAAVPLDQLVPAGVDATEADVDAVAYRPALAQGTYRADQQVLVSNRSYEGAPGWWVLTPLVQDDGTAVVVNRGWVPFSYTEDGPWTDFEPPAGRVTVQGLVRAPQVRSTGALVAGPQDAEEGVLRSLARVDVGRLQQQVDESLLPLYLELDAQEPAQSGELPIPVPDPELSEGPHLGYAGQWFLFAALTCIVYPLLLRRRAHRRHEGEMAVEPGPPDEGGAGHEGPEGEGPLGPGPDADAPVTTGPSR